MQKSKQKLKILYEKNLSFKKNIDNNKMRLLITANIENINYIKFMLISNINEIIINKFYNTSLRKPSGPINRK